MALPACMSQDGREAVFVGTMLQTGDAVALCDECLVAWTAAVLQAMTGVDPEPFLRAMSDSDPAGDTAAGAPSDQPPAPAPADADPDAGEDQDGWAADRVLASEQAAAGPPAVKPGRGSRGRSGQRTGIADPDAGT